MAQVELNFVWVTGVRMCVFKCAVPSCFELGVSAVAFRYFFENLLQVWQHVCFCDVISSGSFNRQNFCQRLPRFL